MAFQDYVAQQNGGIRGGRAAGPIQPNELQRQAVIDQLGQPSAPVASQPGQSFTSFQRGGQVRQLPGAGAEVTNKLVSTGASAAATAANAANPVSIGTDMLGKKLKPKEEMPTFGGEFGDITDAYGRRFEGAGPGVAGGAVRGAGYGAFAGPIGAGVGAAIGGIVGAATKNATSAFSDFRVEDAADAIDKMYQQAYGRPASEDEIRSALVGQGWDAQGKDRWVGEKNLFSVLGNIKQNGVIEAQQRAALLAQMGGGPEAVAGGPPAGAVREGAPQGSAGPARGILEGFDAGKLADPTHTSPKYVFARIAQQFDQRDPAQRAAMLEALKADPSGYFRNATLTGDILDTGSDDPKFEGITRFDVVRDVDNGGAWQWAPAGGGGGRQASGAASGAGAVDLGAGRGYGNIPDQVSPDVLAQIRAELERIIAGQPSRDALLAQMGA